MMNKHIRLIPALALGVSMSSVPITATAATTINVVDEAPLFAKGSGAFVSIEVTCDSGMESQLFALVSLTQRIGGNTAFGDGMVSGNGSVATVNCDGTPQTFRIFVQNFTKVMGGKPFRPGSATAEASVFVCNPFPCEQAEVTEEIQLVRHPVQ